MANVKAKALTTLMGNYGRAVAGDEIVLNDKHAKELEEKGLIKIIGDAPEEATEPKKGSVRITDQTGKATEKAEAETNHKNPTGKPKKGKK